VDFEVKAAQGRDGRGEVPGSVWETYAAMANTQGGEIVLGVAERNDGGLDVLGLQNPERVVRTFWNLINNRQIVSVNLLRNDDVQIVEEAGTAVLHVIVPRASREQRPVYTGPNPLTGTFRRNHEGDYRCSEREVRRMIADAEQDQRDARILPGYTLGDLDTDSLGAYRNEFRSANPNHVWLTLDDHGLLEQLGGWRRDRESGEEGLTLGGLLMFGTLRAILDAVPDYVLDYREVMPGDPGIRWTDRVTTDGTWSGNLYGFYRRAFVRLVDGLRVPFQTDAGRRVDETPVHRALKEALVNALIHADYSASTPILVLKEHGQFSFRNPGALRIPPERVRAGGTSDCRNRNLQKMFQMIGAAEQAGSGFPTILGAWKDQHWRPPSLIESFEPEHVTLRLSTASLLPEEVLTRLEARFGEAFRALDEPSRTTLATAAIEGRVTNGRLQELLDMHPSALTHLLRALVQEGFLLSHSQRRWTYYTLTPEPTGQRKLEFERAGAEVGLDTAHSGRNTEENPGDTEESDRNTEESLGDTEESAVLQLRSLGRLPLSDAEARDILALTQSIRDSSWAPAASIEAALVAVLNWAQDHDTYFTTSQIALLLGRTTHTVLSYLNPLLDDQRVITQYSGRRAPKQGYRTALDRNAAP
jgi:ATP-dependent DNA helicase RecG